MIEYHIQNDAETHGMSLVNEIAKFVRGSIKPCRREPIDTVITPAEPARKIGHRHDLQHSHAQCSQFRQFFGRCDPIAFMSKRADMHLINDLTLGLQFPASRHPSSRTLMHRPLATVRADPGVENARQDQGTVADHHPAGSGTSFLRKYLLK